VARGPDVCLQTGARVVGPLIYIAAVALLGAFSYTVVLGDIHRLELDTTTPPAPDYAVTPEVGRNSARS